MSDKFDDVVTNWRLMIPIILTAAGLVIAGASDKLVRMKKQRLDALRAEVHKKEASVQLAWMNMAGVQAKEHEISRVTAHKRALP